MPPKTALFVGRDLNARTRLENAAAAAGVNLVTAAPDALVTALSTHEPGVVILDLDFGRDAVLEQLARAHQSGLAPSHVVGYFSHVDEDLGAAARRTGCRALPRGAFWRDLPTLF